MAEELKRLVATRGQRKALITRMHTYIKDLDVDSSDQENVEEVEEKYYEVLICFTKIIEAHPKPSVSGVTSGNGQEGPAFRLPRIQLKTFSGEVGDYQSFISLFNSVIGYDTKLSSCEKLYYLRTHLDREPLELIKHLPLTADNYSVAINLLKERYDNKKQIVNHHINLLLDMPSMVRTSAASLRQLISSTRQHLGALKNFGAPTDHWGLMIIAILQRKIDQYTLRAYHIEKQSSTELPTLTDFLTFLEQRASALETLGGEPTKRHSSLVLVKAKPQSKCKYCTSNLHKLHQCSSFRLSEPQKRKEFVLTNKLCKICLNEHGEKKCFYSFKCSICKGKHNTMLHEEVPQSKETVSQNSIPIKSTGQVSLLANIKDNILLPTVRVKLYDKNGQAVYVRALLDSGSQVSFVLSELAEQLGCKLQHNNAIITGVCDGVNMTSEQATLNVHSSANNFNIAVTCQVIKNITLNMPQFVIKNENINVPSYINLADNNFYECDKISMLLGCDIFFQVLLREQLSVIPGELFLQNTRFGYVVAGVVRRSEAASSSYLATNFCSKQEVDFSDKYNNDIISKLDETVSQFWQTEKVPEIYTEADTEQELAEQIFQETVILKNNKFEVSLPLKQDVSTLHLGDSLRCAHKRFLNLEARFKKDDELFLKYKSFIEEYVQLGHAKYVDISEYNLDEQAVFFLPHHPVFNEHSETTKLRVVFDASMQTLPGKVSLNHALLNGPVVQQDLFSILILFRMYKFIINCDIQKMFRAISLTPSHRPLQNILWRPTPHDDIKCLQLQTVTYGLKSSSFLATRCLLELVHRYKESFPLAADALLYKTYVDDVNLTSNDENELLKTKEQLIELLGKGGFTLHKWCTNKTELLNGIPESSQHKGSVHFTENEDSVVRTLGIKCELNTDTLVISSPQHKILNNYTKRDVLSFVSKIFDPLGLVGPIVVNAKLLMQQTWLCNIGWDNPLPSNLSDSFKRFADNLNKMQDVVVKRNLDTHRAKVIDLVGFADASNLAYGCCLYLRIVDADGNINVDLLCSKSRINPIKKMTTPRAELNSALLLAQLVKKVHDILKPRFNVNVYLFVDSQVVLAWLVTNPLKLGVYIANRVKCICDLTEGFSWHYVNTAENPADCLSRGIEPHQLQNNQLWFHGPAFLKCLDFHPQINKFKMPQEVPELKTHVVQTIEELPLFTKFSNIDKIKRLLAYVYRFINNCKNKDVDRTYGSLTPQELDHSLKIIFRCEQMKFFKDEIDCLNSKTVIKSNLKALNPFLDNMHILRVGGRLQHADIPYSTKHPIILPKGSNIVRYLIEKEHRTLMHAGPKLVFTNLSLRYHLVNGIREVKHVLHKCIVCFKLKAKHAEQLMGSLPADRVNPCRVFEKVGIDYGGPFNVKMFRVRKPVIYKAYIVLYVCFITKAIHLELVTDLTTDSFLSSLKRFIARRNKPLVIYCDNASTFKGAQNKLNDLYKLQSASDHRSAVECFAADNGICFKFIPSYSPVFAGLWESGIKSVKHHLKRVVGKAILTYEELNTVIIQIEGILNSRPLTALPTTDLNELSYLTPGHFLTGAPLTAYPEGDYTNVPINRLKFWHQCTQMVQHFWKQWHKQYLVQLQSRPKWRNDCNNIKVGTLVIVRDDNVAPLCWPMARVVEVFPGADGKVRALSIRTPKGSVIRTSIYKVCVLPIEDN